MFVLYSILDYLKGCPLGDCFAQSLSQQNICYYLAIKKNWYPFPFIKY